MAGVGSSLERTTGHHHRAVAHEAQVWRCPEGWVASTPEIARIFCLEGEIQEMPLRDVIVELATDFGARLEFVRGEAGQRLLMQYGGLAGLPRW